MAQTSWTRKAYQVEVHNAAGQWERIAGPYFLEERAQADLRQERTRRDGREYRVRTYWVNR